MDIEGIGFVIGVIGAVWMKSSMNVMREYKEQPELKMIGREYLGESFPPKANWRPTRWHFFERFSFGGATPRREPG